MNPAFWVARALVGARNLELAIDTIPVFGAIERIMATKILVGTMDVCNQVGVVATHLVAIVGIPDLTPVCKASGILLKFTTVTVPVESHSELSQMLWLIQSRSTFRYGQSHTSVQTWVSDCGLVTAKEQKNPDLTLSLLFLTLLPLTATVATGRPRAMRALESFMVSCE